MAEGEVDGEGVPEGGMKIRLTTVAFQKVEAGEVASLVHDTALLEAALEAKKYTLEVVLAGCGSPTT